MPLEFDELPADLQRRLAASNPQLAQALADRASRSPRRAATPATRTLVAPRVRGPRESEFMSFERAQARYLEAAEQVKDAYAKRNAQLMVRSTETARLVVVLLALVILTILALGVLGGSSK